MALSIFSGIFIYIVSNNSYIVSSYMSNPVCLQIPSYMNNPGFFEINTEYLRTIRST